MMKKMKNKDNTVMEKLWNQQIMHYRNLRALDKCYLKKKKTTAKTTENVENTVNGEYVYAKRGG